MRATTAFAVAHRNAIASTVLGVVLATVMSAAVGISNVDASPAGANPNKPKPAAVSPQVAGVVFAAKNKDRAPKRKPVKPCRNDLVKTLRNAGFKGSNLREAWAIAMRESHGKPRVISSTWDVGLFQFNRAAHSGQEWWNVDKLRTASYSAKVAFEMSRGGKTWYPWGLDGKGNVKAHIYRNIGWSEAQILSHIVEPFQRNLKAFDRLPKSCR